MLKQYPTARYILNRGAWYLLTFFVAVTINFCLPRLGSADPVDIIMGKGAVGLTQEQAQAKADAYKKEFGLVKVGDDGQILYDANGKAIKTSLFEQYLTYVKQVMHGDLGTSIVKNLKVLDVIGNALPWTIALQLPTILIG